MMIALSDSLQVVKLSGEVRVLSTGLMQSWTSAIKKDIEYAPA